MFHLESINRYQSLYRLPILVVIADQDLRIFNVAIVGSWDTASGSIAFAKRCSSDTPGGIVVDENGIPPAEYIQ